MSSGQLDLTEYHSWPLDTATGGYGVSVHRPTYTILIFITHALLGCMQLKTRNFCKLQTGFHNTNNMPSSVLRKMLHLTIPTS